MKDMTIMRPSAVLILMPVSTAFNVFIKGPTAVEPVVTIRSVPSFPIILSLSILNAIAEGKLSLDSWKTVLAYAEPQDSLPKGVDATLLELLKQVLLADWAQAGSVEEKIIGLILIKKETVKCLTNHFGLPGFNSYPDVAVLTKVKKVSDFVKNLSIDAAGLLSWASRLADFEQTSQVAQVIWGSNRAKFTGEDWGKIVRPL